MLRAETLDLTASGIREGRDAEGNGMGRPSMAEFDFGVDAFPGTKEKAPFNFLMARGMAVSATGVGGSGCSTELALDMEGVRLANDSWEVWLSFAATGSWVEVD